MLNEPKKTSKRLWLFLKLLKYENQTIPKYLSMLIKYWFHILVVNEKTHWGSLRSPKGIWDLNFKPIMNELCGQCQVLIRAYSVWSFAGILLVL